VLLTTLVWIAVAYFVLPLVWLMIASTKTTSDLFSSFGFALGDEFALWDNLIALTEYKGGVFWRWMINSAIYSTAAAVGAALIATLAGYAFAKYRFPGDKALFGIALGSIMIPATALAIPQYTLASAYQLTNSPMAVILPALASPIGVFIMRVYAADAVPDELIEAARVDGAGEWRIFGQISLRLVAPAFVTILLFSLVGSWNNYLLPLLMIRDPQLFPVTVGLAQMNAQSNLSGGADIIFSTVLMGSLVSVIPLIIAFIYLQRYWQTGLTAGAVKS
jgi:multiple sugar transport system permease protein